MKRVESVGDFLIAVERLTVYGADWCPDVRRIRKALDGAGISYMYTDLDQDKCAIDTVRQLQGGKRRIPTLVWPDGTVLVEPSNDELFKHLVRRTTP